MFNGDPVEGSYLYLYIYLLYNVFVVRFLEHTERDRVLSWKTIEQKRRGGLVGARRAQSLPRCYTAAIITQVTKLTRPLKTPMPHAQQERDHGVNSDNPGWLCLSFGKTSGRGVPEMCVALIWHFLVCLVCALNSAQRWFFKSSFETTNMSTARNILLFLELSASKLLPSECTNVQDQLLLPWMQGQT